jgi:hypothetical protein
MKQGDHTKMMKLVQSSKVKIIGYLKNLYLYKEKKLIFFLVL